MVEEIRQPWIMVVMTLCQWALAYWVYRDSAKRDVPYRNFWIVATFLFWPVILFYFFYRNRQARGMQLTLEQKAMLHMQERAEAEKKRIAAHREAIAEMKAEEQAKELQFLQEENDRLRNEIKDLQEYKEKAHRELCRVRDEQRTIGKIKVNTEL